MLIMMAAVWKSMRILMVDDLVCIYLIVLCFVHVYRWLQVGVFVRRDNDEPAAHLLVITVSIMEMVKFSLVLSVFSLT
jgi:hypothetical protein